MNANDICDIEHLYSPSVWTKRYESSDECIKDHVGIIYEKSRLVREAISGNLDVCYGPLKKEKYDLFGTDLPDSAPIIFYVHGGYWQEEVIGRTNSSFVATVFHKYGIKSFIIGYELCPTVELQDIIQETESALEVCLKYAKEKNTSGIYLIGHSAGAHLVAHFFNNFTKTISKEDLKLFKAAFLIGGVYDLTPLLPTSYNKPLKLTPDTARKMSPMEHHITELNTDFFVIVGDNDSPAFVTQSKEFEKRLTTQNITSKLVVLENIDHFDIIEKITDEQFEVTQLILRTVKRNLE